MTNQPEKLNHSSQLLQDANFQLAFEYLPIPTLLLDKDMMVQAASRSFLQRYGLPREKVLGQACYQVFHNRSEPCARESCNFPQALKGQEGLFNLHEYRDPQGRLFSEEVHLAPMRGSAGEVLGVIESIRDVSDAKRLEGSLMESNEFLNRLLDSLVGVVIAADLSGRILFLNRSVERVLGFKAQELKGKHLWDLAVDDGRDLRLIRQTLDQGNGQALGIHTQVRRKDGQPVPVRVNASYVYRDDRPVATVGIFTDLRERLKMEDQVLKARLQVVQSDKMARLGRMAAGLAHELNNPLTGIIVFAEMAREGLADDNPLAGDLDGIIEDAERCRQIVRGLLDYSRQSEIRLEHLDLNLVVEQAFGLIRDDSLLLHVDVVRDFASGPLPIEGDSGLLRQVFINLFSNALEAMEGRGRLRVATGIDAQGMRCAEVHDSGPGIAPSDAQRVFDPFFTTKPPGQGTGLGLSVVYGVISRHGGSVEIKQTGPQGTAFLVRLPAHAPKQFQALANGGGEGEEEIIS